MLGLMMWFEEQMLFVPSRYPRGDWQPKFQFEDATFTADDGTKLHGWFLNHEKPRHVILFAHGNGGNVAMWGHDGAELRKLGDAAVLVFDYRGYGRSEGSPTAKGVLADARAARAWLAKRTGVSERDVILAGRSLGTGVAVDLAARDGAKALLLVSPFTSLPDVAAIHYSFVPTHWVMRSRLDSLSLIKDFAGPTLMLHGDNDQLIPFALGERLFAAAQEPKQLVVLRGSGHNDPINGEGLAAMRDFLKTLP